MGEVTIDNGHQLDAVAALVDASGLVRLAVYIRSNDQFTIGGIQDATYELYFTLGEDWDEGTARFTRRGSFFRFEEPLEFRTIPTDAGRQYTIYELTLHGVPGGTAQTPPVAQDEFPDLS